ncbi:putative hydrolase of the HAD superfamily [Oceanobacillus limi]|uniref:Putative hydrolase of the HAD superfamily n=2 Tax=Oceanobacillus limi TaxID=930131 RepID=A0A1H9Y2Q8_9BACI|nr:putative hydrolase of the HAD superfamily [Oceanobacillus limi]
MGGYQAMLFDLDDTLVNRDQAVDNMFLKVLEACYGDVKQPVKNHMLNQFKEYDKKSFGYDNKINVLESLFDEFPPTYRLSRNDIQDFWNQHFANCFSINQQTLHIVNMIKEHVKVAIITNGSTKRQKAKIRNTNLDSCFDTILISEEVGMKKPDKRIFDLALDMLHVPAESALFVGDDMEKDIDGSQQANMKGIWFNPQQLTNDTEIKPYAEIDSLDRLLRYIT